MLLSTGIRLTGVVALLLLAGTLAASHARPSFSSPASLIRLDPATMKVDGGAGTAFTIDVIVEGVTDLGAFEFEIDFDTSFVKITDIEEGPFLGSTMRAVSCAQLSLGSHVEKYGCETTGPTPPGPDGSGVAATIHFAVQGHAYGETRLFLRACGAANVLGEGLFGSESCKDSKITLNPPTATPDRNPSMEKLPPIRTCSSPARARRSHRSPVSAGATRPSSTRR